MAAGWQLASKPCSLALQESADRRPLESPTGRRLSRHTGGKKSLYEPATGFGNQRHAIAFFRFSDNNRFAPASARAFNADIPVDLQVGNVCHKNSFRRTQSGVVQSINQRWKIGIAHSRECVKILLDIYTTKKLDIKIK